jgi:hypothetical protein
MSFNGLTDTAAGCSLTGGQRNEVDLFTANTNTKGTRGWGHVTATQPERGWKEEGGRGKGICGAGWDKILPQLFLGGGKS